VKTTLTDGTGKVVAEAYYFRLLIKNSGKRRAEEVEVYAEKLEREDGKHFRTVDEFPPMDLKWSHVGRPLQSISPGLQKHCDLGYVSLPLHGLARRDVEQWLSAVSRFVFELEVRANQGGWDIGAGVYRLHVALAASNASVQRSILEIRFTGQWNNIEAQKFAQEIDIRVVAQPMRVRRSWRDRL
jgi:hypothetical protein